VAQLVALWSIKAEDACGMCLGAEMLRARRGLRMSACNEARVPSALCMETVPAYRCRPYQPCVLWGSLETDSVAALPDGRNLGERGRNGGRGGQALAAAAYVHHPVR
jgi:hypothetical protein